VGIVWHYEHTDLSFGSWQAAECQNHIQNALGSSYPIHTLLKKKSIEVMPRNVNKGMNCRRILDHHQGRLTRRYSNQQMDSPYHNHYSSSPYTHHPQASPRSATFISQPSQDMYLAPAPSNGNLKDMFDFILCIGDDRADEYMFEYLQRVDAAHQRGVLATPELPHHEPISPVKTPTDLLPPPAVNAPAIKVDDHIHDAEPTTEPKISVSITTYPSETNNSSSNTPLVNDNPGPSAEKYNPSPTASSPSYDHTVGSTGAAIEDNSDSVAKNPKSPVKTIAPLHHYQSLPALGAVDKHGEEGHQLLQINHRHSTAHSPHQPHQPHHHHHHGHHGHQGNHHNHHHPHSHHHHHQQHTFKRSIYTATVGSKSSNAKWYIPGVMEVLELLEVLAGLSTNAISGNMNNSNNMTWPASS
jgi:hypothetical protein